MMSIKRALAITIGLALGASSALAQFSGPAPLAWRWQQPTTISPTGSVAIDGNVIYVASGQRMYALNREDGNQKWRYPVGKMLDANFKGSPVLAGGMVIAAADNRTLYAVDAKTGQSTWEYISPSTIVGSPQVSGNLVLFQQSDGSIMAVTVDKGEPFYKTPIYLKDGVQGTFSIWKDEVFVFSTLNRLYAFNVASEKVIWQRDTAGVSSDVSAVVNGDKLYFVSNNYLLSVNAGDGQSSFSTRVEDNLASSPAVSSKGILALTQDGKAYGFTLTGERLTDAHGQLLPPVDLHSGPIVPPTGLDSGLFVVCTEAGTIELVDPASGVLWNYPVRPIGGIQDATPPPTKNGGTPGTGGAPGRGNGGGALGGLGNSSSGGGGGGAQGGPPGGPPGLNRGGPTETVAKIATIQAAGPAVLDGSTLLMLGRDGSLLAFDRSTGVDLTPPKVTMTFPNSGDTVSPAPPLALVFKIEDEASGVKEDSIKITVNGQAMDYEFTKEGVAIVRFSMEGKNQLLSNGKKRIVVEVSDWMGNVTRQPYTLTIDRDLPPVQPVPDNQNQKGGGPSKGGAGGAGGGGQAGYGG